MLIFLPVLAWAGTGLVFLVKPGYEGAYARLPVRTYPLERSISLAPHPEWLETRLLRTVLGEHLLTLTPEGWQHLDPRTMEPWPAPTDEVLRALIDDAITSDRQRYGRIAEMEEDVAVTDTGVRIRIDWDELRLSQRGRDTDWIDALYRVHYLQWTGLPSIDRVLGVAGPVLLASLAVLGLSLLRRPRTGT
ncbi:MAG: hypothetical protein HY722_04985 [Planctomycetes bacterium]|nr:hypothetical protein [Planctomycetota bacterium]